MSNPPTNAPGVAHTLAELAAADKFATGNRNAWKVGEAFLAGIAYERATLRARVEELEAQRRLWLDNDNNAKVMVRQEREIERLEKQNAAMVKMLERARRDAYIRGFQRGYDKKAEIIKDGPQTEERVRIWAEAHAISYCDQFDDVTPASATPSQEGV